MKTLSLPKGSGDLLPELTTVLEPFTPLFRRATSCNSLERYVTGLLRDLPRKNCETIAQAVANHRSFCRWSSRLSFTGLFRSFLHQLRCFLSFQCLS